MLCCVARRAQVLQLVDEGKLEDGGPSAEKVCMIAVCYHNIAVGHYVMQQVRRLLVLRASPLHARSLASRAPPSSLDADVRVCTADMCACGQVHEACVASQNARRLARLSMAYSNRYMRFFESTHSLALEALAISKGVVEAVTSKADRRVFKNLSADLFSS